MAVLAAGAGRLYGSKDEANGRVNPALEPDYDMDSGYPAPGHVPGGGGHGRSQAAPHNPAAGHHTRTNTAF